MEKAVMEKGQVANSSITVDAPPAKVWKALTDPASRLRGLLLEERHGALRFRRFGRAAQGRFIHILNSLF